MTTPIAATDATSSTAAAARATTRRVPRARTAASSSARIAARLDLAACESGSGAGRAGSAAAVWWVASVGFGGSWRRVLVLVGGGLAGDPLQGPADAAVGGVAGQA
ncbi:MAG: hypothetical protein HND58_08510 [Planctomycetota bacterium]|nr:MAG: hypothetical protein HND58_08510 [Planctomycetota bacterium]